MSRNARPAVRSPPNSIENPIGDQVPGNSLALATWRDRDKDDERTYVVTRSSFRDLIAGDLRSGCRATAFGGKHEDTVVEYACDILRVMCSGDVVPAVGTP